MGYHGIRDYYRYVKVMIGYLLSPSGYCFGVKRTVDMAEQVLKLYGSVYIAEDIVRNKLFMDSMLARGAIKVSSLDEVPNGSAIMFSTRGVSLKVLKKADEKQLTVIDATCPTVRELQDNVIAKADEGYVIILIGNRVHQQIATLVGSINNDDVYIVNGEMDVDLLPNFEGRNVVYFTQTSAFPGDIEKIVSQLTSKIPNIKSGYPNSIHNICSETLKRQSVIAEIAPKIDLLIVLGSAHSANAMSLVRTGIASNIKRVVRIDTKDSIQPDILSGVENFAIIGSTSFDNNTMNEIENSLQSFAGIEYIIYPQEVSQ